MGNQSSKHKQSQLKNSQDKTQITENDLIHLKYTLSGPEQLLQFMGCYAWKNIASLNIGMANFIKEQCQIGSQGCKILVQAKWVYLRNINLRQNKIGNQGVTYLVKSQWKNLKNINLLGNGITDGSCFILPKGNWPLIKNIELNLSHGKEKRRNMITEFGLSHLTMGNVQKYGQIKPTSKYFYYPIDREADLF